MIEGVVSRRMDVEEALRRSGRLKPLQFTFAPPNRLMRVLGSIAEVDIRSLTRGSAHGQPRIISYETVHKARFPAPRARGGRRFASFDVCQRRAHFAARGFPSCLTRG
jgi:hypothetical protein